MSGAASVAGKAKWGDDNDAMASLTQEMAGTEAAEVEVDEPEQQRLNEREDGEEGGDDKLEVVEQRARHRVRAEDAAQLAHDARDNLLVCAAGTKHLRVAPMGARPHAHAALLPSVQWTTRATRCTSLEQHIMRASGHHTTHSVW